MPLLPNASVEEFDEILAKKMSLEEIREKYYADIDPDTFDTIMLEDPTYGPGSNQIGRFGKQLVQWWKNDPSSFETRGKWKELLGAILEMEEKKILPPGFQINKYRTGEDLADAISPEAEEIRKAVAPFDPTSDKRYTKVLAQIYKTQGKNSFPEAPTRQTGFCGWYETLKLYDTLAEKPKLDRDTRLFEFKLAVAMALGKVSDNHYVIVSTEPTLTVHTKSKFSNEAFGIGANWCTTWENPMFWQKYTADQGVLLQFMKWNGSIEESVLKNKVKHQLFIDHDYKRIEMENQVKDAVETKSILAKIDSFGVEDKVADYIENLMGDPIDEIMEKARGVNDDEDEDEEVEATSYFTVASDSRYGSVSIDMTWGRAVEYDEYDDGSDSISLSEVDFTSNFIDENPLLMIPANVAKELDINPFIVSGVGDFDYVRLRARLRENGFSASSITTVDELNRNDINDADYVLRVSTEGITADDLSRYGLLNILGDVRRSDHSGHYYVIGRGVTKSRFAHSLLSMAQLNGDLGDVSAGILGDYRKHFGKIVDDVLAEEGPGIEELISRDIETSIEQPSQRVLRLHVAARLGNESLPLGYIENHLTVMARDDDQPSLQFQAKRFNSQEDTVSTLYAVRVSKDADHELPEGWMDSVKAAYTSAMAQAWWNLSRDYDFVGVSIRGITESFTKEVLELGGLEEALHSPIGPGFTHIKWFKVTDSNGVSGKKSEDTPELFETYRKGEYDKDLAYHIYSGSPKDTVGRYAAQVVKEVLDHKETFIQDPKSRAKLDPRAVIENWYKYISGVPERYRREHPRATPEELANVDNWMHRTFLRSEEFRNAFAEQLEKLGVE